MSVIVLEAIGVLLVWALIGIVGWLAVCAFWVTIVWLFEAPGKARRQSAVAVPSPPQYRLRENRLRAEGKNWL